MRSFCMSYISMYPCACVYACACVCLCVYVDAWVFMFARTRFPFVEKARGRDSARVRFGTFAFITDCSIAFYRAERPVSLCSMISKLYSSYRKKTTKKKNSAPEMAPAVTSDDRSHAPTGLNRSDFCINSYI